jgi:hypothetical protein
MGGGLVLGKSFVGEDGGGDASGGVLSTAPQRLAKESKFGVKRWGGQLLLTAKATSRNKFWKGQPLAR